MLQSAQRLQDAGADIVLLECVPNEAAQAVTEALSVPVIGIGAGPEVDGQILVLYDILDITQGRTPRFVKNFQAGVDSPLAALQAYVRKSKTDLIRRRSTASPDMVVQCTTKRIWKRTFRSGASTASTCALVPTMGNLHEGHLSLVELAREHAERVVVSIFVNPTQFGEGEDFDEYPRTLERDTLRLRKMSADLIFAPDVDTVYPYGVDGATAVTVPKLTDNFCGASRPGHFDGVTTVVARLFALVHPDVAVFGQKDYQQQLVIALHGAGSQPAHQGCSPVRPCAKTTALP